MRRPIPGAASSRRPAPAGPRWLARSARRARRFRRGGPRAHAAVAHVQAHGRAAAGGLAQAAQPGAQQGGGFHFLRKDAARCAHEGGYAQRRRPLAHGLRAEGLQPGGCFGLPRAVAADEGGQRLAVREVQPAFARQQEFAASGGHGVKHVHRHARLRQHLRRHQPRRAGADDGGGHAGGGRGGVRRAGHGRFSLSWRWRGGCGRVVFHQKKEQIWRASKRRLRKFH